MGNGGVVLKDLGVKITYDVSMDDTGRVVLKMSGYAGDRSEHVQDAFYARRPTIRRTRKNVRSILEKLGVNGPSLGSAVENALSHVTPEVERVGKLIYGAVDKQDKQLDLFIILWLASDKRVRPLVEELFELIYHDSFEHGIMHRFDKRGKRSE